MNDFFNTKFFYCDSDNYVKVGLNNFDDSKHYHLIMSDDEDDMYYAVVVEPGFWYNFNVNVYKWNFKLLEFDDNEIHVMVEDKFDFQNFNISLISDDEEEIKIWKYYLWLVQMKFDCKFEIIINKEFIDNEFDEGNYVKISRESYNNYIKKTTTPLRNDYSSLTIITTLFNVLNNEEKNEILNHVWLTK